MKNVFPISAQNKDFLFQKEFRLGGFSMDEYLLPKASPRAGNHTTPMGFKTQFSFGFNDPSAKADGNKNPMSESGFTGLWDEQDEIKQSQHQDYPV